MALLGITEEEQSNIFAVLAAILHLGNMTFSTNKKNTAAVHDEESTWCTTFFGFTAQTPLTQQHNRLVAGIKPLAGWSHCSEGSTDLSPLGEEQRLDKFEHGHGHKYIQSSSPQHTVLQRGKHCNCSSSQHTLNRGSHTITGLQL